MKYQIRGTPSTVIGIALLAVSLGIFLANHATSPIHAAQNQPVAADILKIAATIKDGNNAAAKKQAAALAAKIEDLEHVMRVFKPRKKDGKGGVGVGNGGITPDGIELLLYDLEAGKFGAAAIAKEAAVLEEMAQRIAAVAEVTDVKLPEKFVLPQKKENWLEWSATVRMSAAELAKAAKAKNAQAVKTIAGKINAACNLCHTDFR